jgi:hypothetical protein
MYHIKHASSTNLTQQRVGLFKQFYWRYYKTQKVGHGFVPAKMKELYVQSEYVQPPGEREGVKGCSLRPRDGVLHYCKKTPPNLKDTRAGRILR